MLIREQGKSIKLLRIEPATPAASLTAATRRRKGAAGASGMAPRTREVVAGTFRVDEPVPATLLASLTPDERRTLSRWLSAYVASQQRDRARTVLASSVSQLDGLVEALGVAADALQPDDADRLWHQVHMIARALRRAGHPRPKRERRVSPPLPGQRDLIDELDVVGAGSDPAAL